MCFSKTWRHGYCALRNANNLCYALFKWSLGLINHPSSWNVQVKTHKQARVYLLLQTSLVKTPVRTFKTAGTGLIPVQMRENNSGNCHVSSSGLPEACSLFRSSKTCGWKAGFLKPPPPPPSPPPVLETRWTWMGSSRRKAGGLADKLVFYLG